MRNTLEHKITLDEVLAALERAAQRERDDDRVGGIDGVILADLHRELERRPQSFFDLFIFNEHYTAYHP